MVCFEAEGEEKQETKGNSNGNVIKTCRAGANDAFLSASLGGISSHYGGETSASFKELSVLPWRANFASKYPGKERREKERNVEERGRTWRNVERASIRRRTQLRSARYLFERMVLARLYRISTNSPTILLFFRGTQGPIPSFAGSETN